MFEQGTRRARGDGWSVRWVLGLLTRGGSNIGSIEGKGRGGRTVGGEPIVGVSLEGLGDRDQAAHEPDVSSFHRLHGSPRGRE